MDSSKLFIPWLVWNVDGNVPRFQHRSLEAAAAEAERLAKFNPGQTFYVMKAVGRAIVYKPAIYQPLDKSGEPNDLEVPF